MTSSSMTADDLSKNFASIIEILVREEIKKILEAERAKQVEPYKTLQEAAEYFAVSALTISNICKKIMAKSDTLDVIDLGKGAQHSYRVRLSAIQTYLRKPAANESLADKKQRQEQKRQRQAA